MSEEKTEATQAGWGMMELPVLRDCHGTDTLLLILCSLTNCDIAIQTLLDP